MKILIAYDGSECSDAAIVDLRRAGLPAVAEALVLSVAEVSPHPAAVPYGAMLAGPGVYGPSTWESEESTAHLLQEAKAFAAQATDRLRADFPGWHFKTEAWADAAGPAIIRQSHGWGPDLIVLGSHGRSGISRLVLGSVSQKVIHHVGCSVRVSRHRLLPQKRAIRLLVGVDGSDCARTAVSGVAARNWPPGTEVRVLGVLDSRIPIAAAGTLEGAIPVTIEDECQRRLSEAVHEAAQELAGAGLFATRQLLAGKPCDVLLAEAEIWAADCVFVGARGLSRMERFLLGSVSATVASRAHCSVEIVRPNVPAPSRMHEPSTSVSEII